MLEFDECTVADVLSAMIGGLQRLHKCRFDLGSVAGEAGDVVQIDSDCRQVYFDA